MTTERLTRELVDAVAKATDQRFRPLATTAAFWVHAVGSREVKAVVADAETFDWSVRMRASGALTLVTDNVVAFVEFDSPLAAAGPQSNDGRNTVTVVPRSSVVSAVVSCEEIVREPWGSPVVDLDTLPWGTELTVSFEGRLEPLVVRDRFSSVDVRDLIAWFIDDVGR
ncbi:MAG: hypothetical protein BGO38_11460 [Cellulomonas sp. 73-145]|uniref:hypothetical protein n=1 Tax=Cellulomonas sp. 73-145 TaxID=1895739 RepID=UPI000927068C|nr:hypothetical protein [Cellulomonas sp. 73-145]MBN9325366.1 hypothetical protein [Cellulomonas sp.]OJV57373.1 MAG: hypothetical protein BGO38_11460 [Cellulomonas sp. 73-145]